MAVENRIFWAIHHKTFGFFCGTHITRRDAIARFTFDLAMVDYRYPLGSRLHDDQRKAWAKMKRQGYRAVKVQLRPV